MSPLAWILEILVAQFSGEWFIKIKEWKRQKTWKIRQWKIFHLIDSSSVQKLKKSILRKVKSKETILLGYLANFERVYGIYF